MTLFRTGALDILIELGEHEGKPPSFFYKGSRTKFLRFRELVELGFIRVDDDKEEEHLFVAQFTKQGKELYNLVKKVVNICDNPPVGGDSKVELIEPKIIVFHPIEPLASVPSLLHGYRRTEYEINAGMSPIHTTQMALLSTRLFEKGYRVYVSDQKGEYEITLGVDNERTNREIKMEHNLFNLWRRGEFD